MHEQAVAVVQERLGDEAFAVIEEAGHSRTCEQASAHALAPVADADLFEEKGGGTAQ